MSGNPAQKSALMSIAEYSDSEEDEEEQVEDVKAHSSLGGLVEILRSSAQADQSKKEEECDKDVEKEDAESNDEKPQQESSLLRETLTQPKIVKPSFAEFDEVETLEKTAVQGLMAMQEAAQISPGRSEFGKGQTLLLKQATDGPQISIKIQPQESVDKPQTKIVRLDSGKVVKIQLSPTRRTESQISPKSDDTGLLKVASPPLQPKIERELQEIKKLSPVVTISRIPEENTGKLRIKPISPTESETKVSPPKATPYSSSAEIRDILSKRLGSHLDISLLPKPQIRPVTVDIPPQRATYQASFQNTLKSPPLGSPKIKTEQLVPGIVIKKIEPGPDGRMKVMPSGGKISLSEPSEKAMNLMTHSFENLSKNVPVVDLSQESTSSDNSEKSYPKTNVDFDDIIGSNILRKDASEQQHVIVPQPVPVTPPTPRKRGRPRKVPPPVDPNPLVATWPPEGMDCFPVGDTPKKSTDLEEEGDKGGTRTRRSRRDGGEFEMLELPKRRRRRRKMEMGDDGPEDKKGLNADSLKPEISDTPKQRRKRRKGPFYVKRKTPQTPKPKEKENVQNFEEETRMSASELTLNLHGVNDESLSNSMTPAASELNMPITKSNTGNKKGRMEISTEGMKPITVQQLVEYSWPPLYQCGPDEKPESYMIQEQISEFLGCKSFKRKYPTLKRRSVEMEERNYLQENGFVSESMCDMGLTAVCTADVMDIMYEDFPHKYDEYRKYTREKKAREQKALREKQAAERADMDPRQEALEAVAAFNAEFNKIRKEKRQGYFDMQTFQLHTPRENNPPVITRQAGNYPLALVAGQNTDYYKEYSSATLKYFPLNTVLYGPMRPNERQGEEGEPPGSGDEEGETESGGSSSSDDSSSSSSDDSQDSSSSDDDKSATPPRKSQQTMRKKMGFAGILENKCRSCGEIFGRLITCFDCNLKWHPNCLYMTDLVQKKAFQYNWQCVECKSCSVCKKNSNPEKMIFCDHCDRGYHTFCIGMQRVPEGNFACESCESTKKEKNILNMTLSNISLIKVRNVEE